MTTTLDLVAIVAGLCAIAWLADRYSQHQCPTCHHTYANRPALNRHRKYAHTD